jgi:hypothetical protein
MYTGATKGKRARGMMLFWPVILAGVLLLAVPAGAYFIEIDQIGDRGVGDRFTITASTDLPAGEEVLVTVYATSFTPTQKSQSGEFSGVSGSTVVTPGGGQLNRISFDVDASTFRPDLYMVSIQAIIQDATGNARFRVLEKVLVDYFITINTIGDRYVGDRVTITADTNLPQGEDVVLTVTSPSFSLTRNGKVTTGGGGVNRVSYYLDTSAWSPDTYEVRARAVSGGSSSPTMLFRLLQWPPTTTPTPATTVPPTTIPPGPDITIDLFTAVMVFAGLGGLVAVGLKVLGGKPAAETGHVVRGDVKPEVRLEVQRGMEVEGMDMEKAGIRLEVEGGIETTDETMKGGSG